MACFYINFSGQDPMKIKDKDRVYRLGYQYIAELQNYLEKLYLANS